MSSVHEQQKGKSIEVYQSISFDYPYDEALRLREALRQAATRTSWREAPEWERKFATNATKFDRQRFIAYVGEIVGKQEHCYISIQSTHSDSWIVPNVVPKEFGKIEMYEYNDTLGNFVNCILTPALKTLNTDLKITPRSRNLRQIIKDEK